MKGSTSSGNTRKVSPRGLTMAQLVEETGVSRATIAHYRELGLLPPLKKTARNMAYYSETTVERIRLIRELMEKRHLTLSQIRALLLEKGEEKLKELLEETREMERFLYDWLGGEGQSFSREELLERTGIEPEVLDQLKELGLIYEVSPGMYDSVSYDLAMAVSRMRRAGLTEALGFSPQDLKLYVRAIRDLVQSEIREFNRRVFGKIPRHKVRALVQEALAGSEILWVALRRRIVLEFLAELGRLELRVPL